MVNMNLIRKGHKRITKPKCFENKNQYHNSGVKLKTAQKLGGGMGKIERATHSINSKGERIRNGHTWSKSDNNKKWFNWDTPLKDAVAQGIAININDL